MTNRNPFVKNKAFAIPTAFFLRDLFEIFQNTAFELIYLVKPQTFDKGSSLLAANPPGAEHSYFLAFQRFSILLYPFRKLPKRLGLWVECPFKSPDCDFIIIARIDHDRVFI